MMTPLLLLLMFLEPQQTLEQQMLRQQQQLEQISRQLEQNARQFGRMADALEHQPDRRDSKPISICSVEVRRVNGGNRQITNPTLVTLSLFSTVSRPADGCLPAEVRISATYLDASENLVCSGTIESIAVQTSLTQTINLEIRPTNFREFARWKNEPPQINSGAKRMSCQNVEGTAEVTAKELESVQSARIQATILPAAGGMSTTEIQVNVR